MDAFIDRKSTRLNSNDIVSSKVVSDVISVGGLGNFSSSDLRKVLAGKNASVRASIGLTSETIGGSCAPKDLETFMQLVHLSFTSIRQDDEAFQSWQSRVEAQLKNAEANPMTAFSDSLQKTLYNNSPYAKRLNTEMLANVNYERTLNLGRERFANAADFVFTFVGNIDEAQLKGYVETYIGSLPANKGRKENWKIVDRHTVKGVLTKEFTKEMQTPKSTVYSIYTGNVPYTIENNILANMASQVFDMVFTRTIREQEQGTYGVGVDMDMSYYPDDNFTFLFGFDTDVALKERLLKRAYTEIENVIATGISQEDFNKILEYMNKNYEQNLRENNYWLSVINTRFLIGKDMHTTYKATLDSITPEKLHNFVKNMFSSGNRLEVIMNGVAPAAK